MAMSSKILVLKNLNLKIPGITKPILDDINYEVHAGDFVILLGSNGSGKSSLLKAIDRRYQIFTSGEISLAGKKLRNYKAADFCRRVITITQNCLESLFPSLTVLENCVLARQRFENKIFQLKVKRNLQNYFKEYLSRYNQNLSDKLEVKVANLSGGEQQALVLALSILAKPQLLLLDEHTSALDPAAANRLMQITATAVSENKITCLLSTHDLDIAIKYGNRILALKQGKIRHQVEAAAKENISPADLLHDCY